MAFPHHVYWWYHYTNYKGQKYENRSEIIVIKEIWTYFNCPHSLMRAKRREERMINPGWVHEGC